MADKRTPAQMLIERLNKGLETDRRMKRELRSRLGHK